MDLSDIFGDKSKEIAESLDELTGQAQATAEAYDETREIERRYKAERQSLMEEVDNKLSALKEELDQAKFNSDAMIKALLETMEKSDTPSISLPDRKAVHIKTIAGRRKTISLKWLSSTLGKQKANEIWGKVEKAPDKKELVIPPRFDDEPSD